MKPKREMKWKTGFFDSPIFTLKTNFTPKHLPHKYRKLKLNHFQLYFDRQNQLIYSLDVYNVFDLLDKNLSFM